MQVVSAINGCMVDCIYYDGADAKMIASLKEMGVPSFVFINKD